MIVILCNDLPPAVRGRIKLWFIEPRPNVFISGIKDSVADTVIEYLHKHCPPSSGIMVFRKDNTTPGYKISGLGELNRGIITISGLQLVIEKTLK